MTSSFKQKNDWHCLGILDYQEFDAVVNLESSPNDSFFNKCNVLEQDLDGEIKAVFAKNMEIGNQVESFL